MKRLHLVFLSFLLIAMPLQSASTGTIKGRVTDAETGKPLVGVTIKTSGAGRSTLTDAKGKYLIKKVPAGMQKVTVSRRGYTTQTRKNVLIREGKSTTLDVQLVPVKPEWKDVADHRTEELTKNKPSEENEKGIKPEPIKEKPTPYHQLSKIVEKKPSKSGNEKSLATDSKTTTKKPNDGGTNGESDPTGIENREVGVTESLPPHSDMVPESSSLARPSPSSPVESEDSEKSDDASTDRPVVRPGPEGYAAPEFDLDDMRIDMMPPSGKAALPAARPAPPQSGGLKAGFADDNQQFNYFLNFLNNYRSFVNSYSYDITERIHLMLHDKDGRSLPNVEVKIFDRKESRLLDEGRTYADGSYFFYPSEVAANDKTFYVGYTADDVYHTIVVKRNGPRNITIRTDKPREAQQRVAVDIVFILDTTGSMGEEIKRLIATIDLIHMNLSALSNQTLIRFGMVLYRDKDDKYRTQVVPLTADIDAFREALEQVKAGGGGDTPEDLQTALHKAMRNVDWNEGGLRLGFVITDAAAHLDYGQRYTYISAALEAKKQGIKLFTVGTGGLGLQGEYVLRQISQLTYAKYLFLTYGKETGENAGGVAGSVSHHTGSNYQTDKLEAIIMRLAKEEISNFTDEPLEIDTGYFEAEKVDHESKEETLSKLFKESISNLIDYSTLKIEDSRRLGVLPIHANTENSELNAEYFLEQVQLSVAQNNQFILIARKDLQAVLEEQKLQLSGLLTEAETTKIGELLGAELLLAGELYKKDGGYDLFLKLLRVQTAEILAVTKIIIDEDLGL